MSARGNRDQIVLATKYSSNYQVHQGFDGFIPANYGGNGSKSLHLSVADSIKKLQTSYIDILYIHWWDFTTSIPELMLSLNALLNQGKVLYLGASDLPAYIVAKANEFARCHGLRGFVVYQGRWSVVNRDFERDILDLVREEGMGLAPWNALGGGEFKTAAQREEAEKNPEQGRATFGGPPNPVVAKVNPILEAIAKEKATGMTSVALAYVMQKAPYVFPLVGGRKLEHLKANIEALGVELTPEEIQKIEDAAEFDPGFPYNALGRRPQENWLLNSMDVTDYVKHQVAIGPHKQASQVGQT